MISEVLLVPVFECAVMSADASVNGPAIAGVPRIKICKEHDCCA